MLKQRTCVLLVYITIALVVLAAIVILYIPVVSLIIGRMRVSGTQMLSKVASTASPRRESTVRRVSYVSGGNHNCDCGALVINEVRGNSEMARDGSNKNKLECDDAKQCVCLQVYTGNYEKCANFRVGKPLAQEGFCVTTATRTYRRRGGRTL